MKNIIFRLPSLLFLLIIIFQFSNCATIFMGTSRKVDFNANPIGAKVYVDDRYIGKTPISIKLESKKTHFVRFEKEGYETRTYTLTNSVGAGWVILDVIFGLVPIVIDAITGAWYSFDEDNLNISLDEKSLHN